MTQYWILFFYLMFLRIEFFLLIRSYVTIPSYEPGNYCVLREIFCFAVMANETLKCKCSVYFHDSTFLQVYNESDTCRFL